MKVAVVGCGINGAYLAWKLQKKAHEVTVYEKKSKIGKEVCSGLISDRLWWYIPKNEKLILNRINYCNIHFPKKTIKLKFKQSFSVIDRKELDNYVADLAREAGTKILLNTVIDKIPANFDRIIGADGALSTIRHRLDLPEPKYRLGLVGFVNNEDKSDCVDVYPVETGFAWKIPRGNSIEYGILAEPELAKKEFEKFCEEQKVSFEKPLAAMIPSELVLSKNLNIALSGDAAGLTKPWSGGGVIWGLIGADILLRTFPNFAKYHNELKGYFIPKIRKSKRLTDWIYFLGNKLSYFLPSYKEIDSDFIF